MVALCRTKELIEATRIVRVDPRVGILEHFHSRSCDASAYYTARDIARKRVAIMRLRRAHWLGGSLGRWAVRGEVGGGIDLQKRLLFSNFFYVCPARALANVRVLARKIRFRTEKRKPGGTRQRPLGQAGSPLRFSVYKKNATLLKFTLCLSQACLG